MINKKFYVLSAAIAFLIVTFTSTIYGSSIRSNDNNSFNPLTATNSELISHGYPSRPTDKKALTN